jgi:cytochrome c oxidase cbb3-type subunit III
MTQPIHAIAPGATDFPDEVDVDDGPLLSHAYDGIREYDNPLPGWWRGAFWGTIVFAAFYALYFHVIGGESVDDRYRAAVARYEESRASSRGPVELATEGSLERDAQSDETLAKGADVFAARCAACHKEHGEGLIGPNLTDRYQKHGSTRMDIYNTIRDGAQGTPMIAWGEQLPLSEVNAVAAYVTTLRGKNLTGKAPEGQPVGAF